MYRLICVVILVRTATLEIDIAAIKSIILLIIDRITVGVLFDFHLTWVDPTQTH